MGHLSADAVLTVVGQYEGLRVYPIAVFLSEALGAPVIESLRLCVIWTSRSIPDSLEKGFGSLYFAFLPWRSLAGLLGLALFRLVSPLMFPWRVRLWPHCLEQRSCSPFRLFPSPYPCLFFSRAAVSVSGFVCLLCCNMSSQSARTLSLSPLVPRCLEPAWQIVGAPSMCPMKVSR